MSLNKITLSGNLGADAELRYTKGGAPVVSFSLAVNERVQNGDGEWGDYTNWVDCCMFGKRDAQSPASANAAAPGLAMATGDPSPVAPAQPAAPDLYDDDVPF